MTFDPLLYFAAAGACGALVSDIFKDNNLELPHFKSGKFYLGFIGSLILGATAGYYIDNSIIMSFMGGFVGKSVIENLVPKNFDDLLKKKNQENKTPLEPKQTEPEIIETVEETIRRIALKNKVNPDLAVKVARCESSLNPKAVNINKTGSKDRGIFQWNDYWHPEISDKCAFDVTCATQKFCEAVNDGKLSWWKATQKCWGKNTT